MTEIQDNNVFRNIKICFFKQPIIAHESLDQTLKQIASVSTEIGNKVSNSLFPCMPTLNTKYRTE